MAKKLFHTSAQVVKRESKKEDGLVEAVVGSTAVIDRMGDSIDQSGWDLKNFKTNPVILWGHNQREERPPIGTALRVWVKGRGTKAAKLMFKVKFDMKDKFAKDIFRKVKDGFINTVSVGFIPKEHEAIEEDNPFGGRKFLKQELLELSFVPVPANPEAVIALREMGIEPKKLNELYPNTKKKKTVTKKKTIKKTKDEGGKAAKTKKTTKKAKKAVVKKVAKAPQKKVTANKVEAKKVKKVEKKVIRYKDLDTAPESTPWDGQGEKAKASIEDLKLMTTYVETGKEDSKGAYKLPHHRQEDKKAIWRGVAASMASLLGARGGAGVPESDRKGVFNHLKKHYKQFDKVVPDFKMVEDQVLADLEEELHALVLDREDRHTVRLIKKVLKATKDNKKTIKETKTSEDNLVKALRMLDKATSFVSIKAQSGKGVE